MTVADVVQYIYDHRENSTYQQWTRGQICSEVSDLIALRHIRVIDNGYYILGVVIFTPNCQGRFWINNIWGRNSLVMSEFVKVLQRDFPEVSEVYGYRHKRRFVRFNLNTLKKIFYGRSKSTSSSGLSVEYDAGIYSELP